MSGRLEHGGKVFLSAPFSADTDWVADLCENAGLTVARMEDIGFGATVKDQLASMIASCDLVIALFSDEQSLANVAYQVGVAHGLNKPTLIIGDPSGRLPVGLLGQQIVLNDETAVDAIAFWLRQVVDARPRPKERWPQPYVPTFRAPSRSEWQNLSEGVRSAWRSGLHSEAERQVAEALQQAGVDFLAQPSFGPTRPDFAAWVDELEGVLGNPFLIEVKGSLRGRADQYRAFDQVKRYLGESNSRWALVLYMDGPAQPFSMSTEDRRMVLFQRFDEFARRLAEGDFADAVRQLRNRAVHGEG